MVLTAPLRSAPFRYRHDRWTSLSVLAARTEVPVVFRSLNVRLSRLSAEQKALSRARVMPQRSTIYQLLPHGIVNIASAQHVHEEYSARLQRVCNAKAKNECPILGFTQCSLQAERHADVPERIDTRALYDRLPRPS